MPVFSKDAPSLEEWRKHSTAWGSVAPDGYP
jgi:hypothetical protein